MRGCARIQIRAGMKVAARGITFVFRQMISAGDGGFLFKGISNKGRLRTGIKRKEKRV